VGTPPGEDGSADLRYVLSAARSVGEHMSAYTVIVDKSTVPVGTAAQVAEAVRQSARRSSTWSPTRVPQGGGGDRRLHEADRVVIGATSQRARDVMEELYAPFVRTGKPILYMDPASAELTSTPPTPCWRRASRS